jgi:y4mF family transcriptional regulator
VNGSILPSPRPGRLLDDCQSRIGDILPFAPSGRYSLSMEARTGTMSPLNHARLEIGASVRRSRQNALLDQADLADLAGVSVRTLRDIETGRGNPGLDAVLAVLHTLGARLEVAG